MQQTILIGFVLLLACYCVRNIDSICNNFSQSHCSLTFKGNQKIVLILCCHHSSWVYSNNNCLFALPNLFVVMPFFLRNTTISTLAYRIIVQSQLFALCSNLALRCLSKTVRLSVLFANFPCTFISFCAIIQVQIKKKYYSKILFEFSVDKQHRKHSI